MQQVCNLTGIIDFGMCWVSTKIDGMDTHV